MQDSATELENDVPIPPAPAPDHPEPVGPEAAQIPNPANAAAENAAQSSKGAVYAAINRKTTIELQDLFITDPMITQPEHIQNPIPTYMDLSKPKAITTCP